MDTQSLIAGFAVWTFACVAFGYWIRGHENDSIAAGDIHCSHDDVEARARRVQ